MTPPFPARSPPFPSRSLPPPTGAKHTTTTTTMGDPPPSMVCYRRHWRRAPHSPGTPRPLLSLALLTTTVFLFPLLATLPAPVAAAAPAGVATLATRMAAVGASAGGGDAAVMGFIASRVRLPRTGRALRTAAAAAACGNSGDTCRCSPPAAPPVQLCLRPAAAAGRCDAGVCAPGWACDCAGDAVCAVARTGGVLACDGGGDGVGGCACGRVRAGGWGLVRVGGWASPGGGGKLVEDRGGGVACGMPDGFWA